MERLSVSRLPSFDTRLSVYTCVSLENFQGDALPPEIKFFDSIFSNVLQGLLLFFILNFSANLLASCAFVGCRRGESVGWMVGSRAR